MNLTKSVESNFPPGPKGLPIVGSLLSVRGDNPHIKINNIARKYGDICTIRFGNTPTVLISHPEIVREAFMRPEFSDRWVNSLIETVSSGRNSLVFGQYDEKWRRLQRYANQNILSHRRVMQTMETYVVPIMDLHKETMENAADAGEPIYFREMLYRMNARTIADVIFGVFGYAQDSNMEKAIDDAIQAIDWAFRNASVLNWVGYFPIITRILSRHIANAVAESERLVSIVDFEALKESPLFDLDHPTCLAEVMLSDERNGVIDMSDVRALIGDLTAAGTDTMTQTMVWLVLTLANRPEIQDRVYEELRRADPDGDGIHDIPDMSKLPYTHAVVIENMRFRTVASFAMPHRAARTAELAGYTIPEGAQILANVYGIHRDERFWDAPNEFRPERFMPLADGSPAPDLQNEAFMPFGVGRRACPGQALAMQMLSLLTVMLFRNFRFEPPNGERIPEEGELRISLVSKPYAVKVTRR